MNKLLSLILVLVLIMALSACKDKSVSQDESNSEQEVGNIDDSQKESVNLSDMDMSLLQNEAPSKIQIYKGNGSYGTIPVDETPLLVIEDEVSIKLFSELFYTAIREDGILNIKAPPHMAIMQFSERSEGVDLYLYRPDEVSDEYRGIFVKHTDTHTEYTILSKYVEAIIQMYGDILFP